MEGLCGAKMKCISCGCELPEGAKFCGKCGAKQEKQKVFCMSCGAEIPDGMAFCMECGTKVGETGASSSSNTPKAPASASRASIDKHEHEFDFINNMLDSVLKYKLEAIVKFLTGKKIAAKDILFKKHSFIEGSNYIRDNNIVIMLGNSSDNKSFFLPMDNKELLEYCSDISEDSKPWFYIQIIYLSLPALLEDFIKEVRVHISPEYEGEEPYITFEANDGDKTSFNLPILDDQEIAQVSFDQMVMYIYQEYKK